MLHKLKAWLGYALLKLHCSEKLHTHSEKLLWCVIDAMSVIWLHAICRNKQRKLPKRNMDEKPEGVEKLRQRFKLKIKPCCSMETMGKAKGLRPPSTAPEKGSYLKISCTCPMLIASPQPQKFRCNLAFASALKTSLAVHAPTDRTRALFNILLISMPFLGTSLSGWSSSRLPASSSSVENF